MTDTIDPEDTDNTSTLQVAEPQPAPANPLPTPPDDVAPPVAALLTSIHAAVAKGAAAETRAAGAAACRSILTVLEAKPGQPLAAAVPQPAGSASPTAALLKQPGFLAQLAAMSREQLLELLKQVTGAMPARSHTPTTAAPRFHLIQIPQVRGPSDGR